MTVAKLRPDRRQPRQVDQNQRGKEIGLGQGDSCFDQANELGPGGLDQAGLDWA